MLIADNAAVSVRKILGPRLMAVKGWHSSVESISGSLNPPSGPIRILKSVEAFKSLRRIFA